jgi:hypothetical protein
MLGTHFYLIVFLQYPDAPSSGSNMGDSHTRVTYRRNATFCERIGNSLMGILVGIALLVIASVLLFWNEVKFDLFKNLKYSL